MAKTNPLPRVGLLDAPQLVSASEAANLNNPYAKSDDDHLDSLRLAKIDQLMKLTAAARAFALRGLTRETFQTLIKIAFDQRILTTEELGQMGRSDRSTASRWLKGESAPNSLIQSIILSEIANRAELRAGELTQPA